MSDSPTIDVGKKFSIRELLHQAPRAGPAEPEPPDAGPEPADSLDEPDLLPGSAEPYRPYSRPSSRPLPMLGFLFRGVGLKILSYGNLESVDLEPPKEPGKGPILLLLFAGVNPLVVRVEGRNLLPLADYLRQHRLAWVRELPTGQDFGGPAATVVTRITPLPVED